MTGHYLQRRAFLLGTVRAGAALAPIIRGESRAQADSGELRVLDNFIRDYMHAMNAPGLTLGLANQHGVLRTAGFGYSNLATQLPVTPDQLFEIGSITKSFVAIVILQLAEQGKLDLHRPILDYLPWLPIDANYGPITIHHLLTHTSGLPDTLALFLTDPRTRLAQASQPGERFHYCNAGFDALGYLIEKLDGREFADAITARILEPLGMASTTAAITNRTLNRRAKSYVPLFDDLTFARQGRLAPAPNLVFSNSAGCISSTPADMAKYMQMLLLRGASPRSRILSEESFVLFSKPYIKAEEFSSSAFYGYGIAVDRLNGHKILRHTGGMVSFASAMHVDLDGQVAAFASINAMQGYRPNPVTEFAIEVMQCQREGKPLPAPPKVDDPRIIKDAGKYAGVYTSPSGKTAEVLASEDKLSVTIGQLSSNLERSGDGVFVAIDPELARFPFVFGRAAPPKGATEEQKKNAAIVEVMHGADWYTNSRFSGPREFPMAPELDPYLGYYRGESPWVGSLRVVAAKGKLWLDGATPLEPLGDNLFRIGSDPNGPETVEFLHLVDGKARLVKVSGADLWRVNAQ